MNNLNYTPCLLSSRTQRTRGSITGGGPGGSMRQVVGSNSSFKPITNTAWISAQLCKLQKGCNRLTAVSYKVYQMLAQGRWFSPGTPASSTTKSGRHDIAEILLKVALKHKKSNKKTTKYKSIQTLTVSYICKYKSSPKNAYRSTLQGYMKHMNGKLKASKYFCLLYR